MIAAIDADGDGELSSGEIEAAAKALLKLDKNGDGKLTREEFLLNQPDPTEAPKRFDKFDANKDGTLSREEFVNSGNVRQ